MGSDRIQLTPLLDLLLIVLFAQYLDLSSSTRSLVADSERYRADAAEYLKDALALNDTMRDELEEKARTIQRLEEERAALREQLKETAEGQEILRNEYEREMSSLGRLVKDLFDVREDEFARALHGANLDEVQRLRQEIETVKGKSVEAIIVHLQTMRELRKRCDIWNVHVQEDDSIVLTVDEHEHSRFFARSADGFENRFVACILALPEPKSLVLILYTYSDAKRSTRRIVEEGLESSVQRLTNVFDRQKRFYVSKLGFTSSHSKAGMN